MFLGTHRYNLIIFLDSEDGTHKNSVENSKPKILVCPSTQMTGIQILIWQPNDNVKNRQDRHFTELRNRNEPL